MNKFTILANLIKDAIIRIQLILNPVKFMDTDSLITSNRLDISLRVKFLEDAINRKKKFSETRYWEFIGIPKGDGLKENPDSKCRQFIAIYKSIKKNGLEGYFTVARINRFSRMEIVFKDARKISNKRIKLKYQLVGGAHRFAVCKFLGYKKVPVKIIWTPFLDFPDLTDFIKRYKI